MSSTSLHELVKVQTVLSLCVVIALFVPVWWHTTQVHRASVPGDAVRALAESPLALRFSTRLSLRFAAEDAAVVDAGGVAAAVQSQLNAAFGALRFAVDGRTETATSNGVYAVNVNCGAQSINKAGAVSVAADRIISIQTVLPCANADGISAQIAAVVGGLFASEHRDLGTINAEAASNDPGSMRKIKYANEYQLMFNLLNADPQSLLMDWNIDDAIKDYFQDFVAIMKKLFDIKVASQVQYYTTLAIQPEKVGSSHVLYPHHLPHFINSAEWGFDGSSVSTSPPINFVLYVPTQSQSPLYIASANTKDAPLVETNAFSIPQWGGIVVLNPDQHSPKIQTNSQTNVRIYKLDSKEELEGPMNVFLEQMRGLLGVKTVELSAAAAEKLLPGFSFTYAGSTAGITKWELDRLTRYTTVKNIGDAISTLNSLITLIESMENMVVLDHIRDEIMLSLNAIHKVQQILSDPLPAGGVSEEDGGHVNQHDVALAASIAAITAAERAFFDPTMVSLLYFPDEHKLAVYLPLFLPVLVPLFSTIVQEIKKEIQKRKGGKVKSE